MNVANPVVIPQSELPTSTPAVETPALPAEIAYLKEHGLDSEASSLQAELEGLLAQRDGAAPVVPTAAPITQAPPPAPAPSEQPAAPKTAQERALDPYAVDGGDMSEFEDVPSVVIDDQGRARDAVTGKYVPIKALHQERAKAKELRTELAQTRELNVRAEERLAILNEILSAAPDETPAPAPEEVAPPVEDFVDPEVDIFKSAKQMQEFIKKQNEYVRKLEEKLSGTEQLTRQQIESMQADQVIRADVTSFYSQNPDFMDAYKHLRTVRDRALTTLGFADKAARDAQIAREEQALAQQAVKSKTSYAERIYKLAQDYGYAKPAPAPIPTPQPPAPAVQAPAAQQPAAPLSVDPGVAAQVRALGAAKDQAGTSLNGAGGTPAEGLTVQQLAMMSESEFLNLAGKLGKAKLDALLRGT